MQRLILILLFVSCRQYESAYIIDSTIEIEYGMHTSGKEKIITKEYKYSPKKYYLIDSVRVSEKKFKRVTSHQRAFQ